MLDLEALHAERPYLLRLAVLQLKDAHLAEDLVQETLLAAIEGATRFRGEASVRTFMVGILRHKIVDRLREQGKTQFVEFMRLKDEEEFDLSVFDVLFKQNGHWTEDGRPTAWPSAEEMLVDAQFWNILEICMANLPRKTAMVFVQREIIGEDISEICKSLHLTPTNCSVMLYRARMILRECLERRWRC